MQDLDASFTERSLAPNSPLAYVFAYVPRKHRDRFRAVLALDEQVARALAANDPEPRYAKLAWWRQECMRLAAGEAAHPVTRALGALRDFSGAATLLKDILDATTRELDHIRFADLDDMLAHAQLRQGSVQKLMALSLSDDEPPGQRVESAAGALGQAWWLTNVLSGAGTADVSIVGERVELANRADSLYKQATDTVEAGTQPIRRIFAVQAAVGRLMLERTTPQHEQRANRPLPALHVTWRAWRAARRAR